MKRRYLQLVLHNNTAFEHYGLHEALMENGETFPYWVGSKALRKYDNYHDAVEAWGKLDKMSAQVDILEIDDILEIMDKVDYGDDEEELNFD